MMNTRKENQMYWIGIDWGKFEHTIVVSDDQHQVIARSKADTSLDGLNKLVAFIGNYQPVGGVAIESTRNSVIVLLLNAGYAVYPINPKLSHQWRNCVSVSGEKSDDFDAYVLATELSRRHEDLRCITNKDETAQEFLGLCILKRKLTDRRTSQLQCLSEVLQRYYPAALEFWTDLGASTAWAFIKRFPTPGCLATVRKSTLIAFLRGHRIGLRPIWLERIEQRKNATAWPTSSTAISDEIMAMACVEQLQTLHAKIEHVDELIAETSKQFKELNLIESLPGAGKTLAPAITAIILNLEDEESSVLEELRCKTGVAPVRKQSGKKSVDKIRHRCNKQWRNVFHLFAFCSINQSSWARAFYNLRKKRGDSYATALRKLADKWIHIIVRMIAEGKTYDENQYLESLKRHGSPIYRNICG
jgi:hypothetical protein